jgi:hypothetical protein
MDSSGNDIQTVDISSFDEETVFMEQMAKTAAQILCDHYPDHLWAVGWHPGYALAIKNMAIPGNYGFTIDVPRIATASEFKRVVYQAGGEMLERAHMSRGRWDGNFADILDGSDPKHFQTVGNQNG